MYIQGESKKVAPLTFFNDIFTQGTSFCLKFCPFVESSYTHKSTNFDIFILKFNKMALILPQVPPVF